ncbi:MAG: hypothetical protein H6Q48_3938 [Deltaproteobacteria bacterium]|nr:hypothetical protein [Deltaproteobacteria bacterium]
MAQFDRAIPPGGEGKITLKVNTSGYEGNVRKTAKVYSNDPSTQVETITLAAYVKVPIQLSSKIVFLQGKRAVAAKRTVEVKGGLEKPLKIEPVEFNLSDRLSYEIVEVKPGKLYQVHFTSIPNTGDSFQGILRLKTNYPEKPEIRIYLRGRFGT